MYGSLCHSVNYTIIMKMFIENTLGTGVCCDNIHADLRWWSTNYYYNSEETDLLDFRILKRTFLESMFSQYYMHSNTCKRTLVESMFSQYYMHGNTCKSFKYSSTLCGVARLDLSNSSSEQHLWLSIRWFRVVT